MAKEERWKGGRRRRGIGATMKDDEELEMLLGEIPHATSLNLHNPHSNGHDHVHGGTLFGVDDDDPLSNCKFTCASPASGFSLQFDGSSSSLFSCRHSCGGGGDFGSGSVTTDERQKRLRTEPPDRLSALLDSLLLRILSLLPTNQATQTASLSKRWLRLWPSVPSLTFSQHQIKTRKFVSSVNRTLAQSNCPEINKFSVEVAYKPKFAPDISRWVAFAIGRNVQELELELKNFDYYRGYDLPQEIFTGLSIRKLRLSECDIAPVGVISWRLLKNLSIEHSHLSGDVIRKISMGCPVLESLVLNECHVVDGITRVEIHSISLSKLVINGYWDPFEVDESLLEVSAPNVRFLEITGDWGKKGVRLVNVSSLFDVKLDFVRVTNIGDDR
ncbi:hypothetical protein RJ639_012673, partial [Escallonia herrerae]